MKNVGKPFSNWLHDQLKSVIIIRFAPFVIRYVGTLRTRLNPYRLLRVKENRRFRKNKKSKQWSCRYPLTIYYDNETYLPITSSDRGTSAHSGNSRNHRRNGFDNLFSVPTRETRARTHLIVYNNIMIRSCCCCRRYYRRQNTRNWNSIGNNVFTPFLAGTTAHYYRNLYVPIYAYVCTRYIHMKRSYKITLTTRTMHLPSSELTNIVAS